MKLFVLMGVSLLSISVPLLSSCVSERDLMLEQGFPLPYADGFDDGCHSGRQAGGSILDDFRKDVGRFNQDARYAQGWTDGYRHCESEEEASQRRVRMAVEAQRLDRERDRDDRHAQRLLREVLRDVDTSDLNRLE